MLKKFLLTILALISFSNIADAIEKFSVNTLPNQSYLILLNSSAIAEMVSNKKMLRSEILTTLYNEKDQILVDTLKQGVARLYIATDKDIAIIEFNTDWYNEDKEITMDSKVIKAIEKIDIVDKVNMCKDYSFELDEPPMLRGEH